MAETLICSHCNTPNQVDDRFCKECGQPLGGETTLVLSEPPVPDADSAAPGSSIDGTVPLSKNTSFLPRPIKAVFGDRFLCNSLIHSDEQQHGYLVSEMVEDSGNQITQCTNPECGAIHLPYNGEVEKYCTHCSAPLAGTHLVLVLFEAHSQIFGNAFNIAEMGLAHAGIRAPVAAFQEVVAGEDRFCLVIPYAEPIAPNSERAEIYRWGLILTSALTYLHQNGLTYKGKLAEVDFSTSNGCTAFASFHDCQVLESVSDADRSADTQALAGVFFMWLTGSQQYIHDSGLSPAVSSLFEAALGDPGFPTAEVFAGAFEDALRQTSAARPLEHKMGRRTDVGEARSLNEDSLLTIQVDKYLESIPQPLGIYVVADGMGGHSAGEVASGTIVNTIAEKAFCELNDTQGAVSEEDGCKWIVSAIQAANKAVYDVGKKMGSDMGSTIVMAVADGNLVCTGHVGDSRAYLINAQGITPLTVDHSLVERLVDTGQITREEARYHPQRNVIYRTMGDKLKLEVDTASQSFSQGDRLLLCSDGLNGMLEDEVMRQIVMEATNSPQDACDRLVQAANAAGGDDNITVVVVEFA